MKVAISVESTNDLSNDLLNKYDIKVIPFQINLGDEIIKDGQMKIEKLFEYVNLNKVLPKTTAINEFEYTEFFKNILACYDAIIHITISSGITSTYENAKKAAKNFNNVFVVDSRSLSTGIGLLAIYARELAEKNISPFIIAKKVSLRAFHIQASFVIERLDYLFKGGRCNSLQLLGANIFKIRPRIILENAKMHTDKKYRGPMEKVISSYSNDIIKEYPNFDKSRAFITYTTATDNMISLAKNVLEKSGFKEVLETKASFTVASHCGENTLGIFYFNDENLDKEV